MSKAKWVPVSERLPDVYKRFNAPLTVGGQEIPPLNTSAPLIIFDGRRVTVGTVDWFDDCKPHAVTHWMPLPAAPVPSAEPAAPVHPPAHTPRRRASGEYDCSCGAVWDADEGSECPND